MKHLVLLAFGLPLFVLGCSPSPDRKELDAVQSRYRPDGQKPSMPSLTADSPLSEFMTYAILNNPAVEAAFYDWNGAVEEVTVARSLEDPQLTLGAEIERVVTRLLIGLMQEIPGPGKLALRAEAFSAMAKKKRHLFEDELLKTAFKVKQTYYEGVWLNEKIRLTGQIVALLEFEGASIEANYKAGRVRTEELAMHHSARERTGNELANLNDSRKAFLARWNGALGVRPDGPLTPFPVATAVLENTLPRETDLLKEAMEHNVRLKALSAEVVLAETLVKLAYTGNVPDFSIGLAGDAKKDPVTWMPALTMTLPIWREKITAQIAAARSQEKKAQAMLSAEQIDLAVLLAEKSFFWRELNRQNHLIQDEIIPLAELKLNNLEASYKTNRATLTDYLTAKHELLEIRLQGIEAITRREVAFSEISLMVLSHGPEEISRIISNE